VKEAAKIGLHIWVSILIVGTLWRLLSLHMIASANPHVQNAGKAMAFQY